MADKLRLMSKFVAHLQTEQVSKLRFVGKSVDPGWGRLYGGQCMGQSIDAARQTVPDDLKIHSMNSLFLKPGSTSKDVVYDVDILRDGRSFSMRRVIAKQDDVPIFEMHASFHRPEESTLEHQHQMPFVALPTVLPTFQDLLKENNVENGTKVHPLFAKLYTGDEKAVEYRPVRFNAAQNTGHKLGPLPAQSQQWFRGNGGINCEEFCEGISPSMLAYLSDFSFLSIALLPHKLGVMSKGVHAATISHGIYFHRELKLDEWHLIDSHSHSLSSSRGFVSGKIYRHDGELVASIVQEGLLRYTGDEK